MLLLPLNDCPILSGRDQSGEAKGSREQPFRTGGALKESPTPFSQWRENNSL